MRQACLRVISLYHKVMLRYLCIPCSCYTLFVIGHVKAACVCERRHCPFFNLCNLTGYSLKHMRNSIRRLSQRVRALPPAHNVGPNHLMALPEDGGIGSGGGGGDGGERGGGGKSGRREEKRGLASAVSTVKAKDRLPAILQSTPSETRIRRYIGWG